VIYLFIHQNFPGQYLHVVRHLSNRAENTVYFITQTRDQTIEGVHKLVYEPEPLPTSGFHPFNAPYERAVRTGLSVVEVCRKLHAEGIVPDIVVGHTGWGETLFVKSVFPDTPLLGYFEFFYHAEGLDVGFDPEFSPRRKDDDIRLFLRNAVARMSFAKCDWGHTATHWQRGLFPIEMRPRITALHEGIDTDFMKPNSEAWLRLARDNLVLTGDDEVITYVARNLEPYRGFHCFMRSLPRLLRRRPRVHVVVVGGDGISYGELPPYGGTYREMMLAELGDELDRDRIHFLGQVPRETYLNVLQISSVHVYLSYPFVLSWSVLEAMSAGCLVLGSVGAPLDEVVSNRENGLLVDPFDAPDISNLIEEVLVHPDRMAAIRSNARRTVVEQYDLNAVAMPQWLTLLDKVRTQDHQGLSTFGRHFRASGGRHRGFEAENRALAGFESLAE
jgi:glycosyltransferase involved in cell wall biosynthesis